MLRAVLAALLLCVGAVMEQPSVSSDARAMLDFFIKARVVYERLAQ
jgi:hypothetical protein